MNQVDIKLFNKIDDELLNIFIELENQIFDYPYSKEKLKSKLIGKKHISAFIIFENSKPAAYKVGFEMDDETYFSWIGGVIPKCRGKAYAKLLMDKQHEFAKSYGFKYVRTHTKNKYKPMIILNVKAGFDIVGIETDEIDGKPKIQMQKTL